MYRKYAHHGAFGVALLIFLLVPSGRSVTRFLDSLPTSILLGTVSLSGFALLALVFSRTLRSFGAKITAFQFLTVSFLLFCFWRIAVSEVEISHIILYGAFSGLWLISSARESIFLAIRDALCLGVFVSLCDECLQWLHPERIFDLHDLILNLIGSLTGIALTLPLRLELLRRAPLDHTKVTLTS